MDSVNPEVTEAYNRVEKAFKPKFAKLIAAYLLKEEDRAAQQEDLDDIINTGISVVYGFLVNGLENGDLPKNKDSELLTDTLLSLRKRFIMKALITPHDKDWSGHHHLKEKCKKLFLDDFITEMWGKAYLYKLKATRKAEPVLGWVEKLKAETAPDGASPKNAR